MTKDQKKACVLLDLDGVLVDTEVRKARTYFDALNDPRFQFASSFRTSFKNFVSGYPFGVTRQRICQYLYTRYNLVLPCITEAVAITSEVKKSSALAKQHAELLNLYPPIGDWDTWKTIALRRLQIADEQHQNVEAMNGAFALLSFLRSAQVTSRLVTLNSIAGAEKLLVSSGLGTHWFSSFHCHDTLRRPAESKVELYKSAFEWSSRTATQILAIEDTPDGVSAASAAGVPIIVGFTKFPPLRRSLLTNGAFQVVTDLRQIIKLVHSITHGQATHLTQPASIPS